jgi:hypothetical protein
MDESNALVADSISKNIPCIFVRNNQVILKEGSVEHEVCDMNDTSKNY